jgi:iron(II)-dependent oxidoreductase
MLIAGISPVAAESPADKGMVLVPGGEFTMGSTEEDIHWAAKHFHSESLDYYRDETPARRVSLDDFYIDRHEVTVSQYKEYLKQSGGPEPKFQDKPKYNQPDQPVVGITWQQASDYCRSAGKRLPSEAEWEQAARGADARRYPWGDEPDESKANVRGKKDGYRYIAPVGGFPEGRSPYGILDMAGDVWEWTGDWYRPYPGNEHKNEMYGETLKVIRGGSWFSNLDLARSTVRGKALPNQRLNYIGFRCVRQP